MGPPRRDSRSDARAGFAGNLPIASGDFKSGYLINDRIGLRVLRDPYSNQPYVIFYCTSALAAACSIGAIGVLRVPA